MNPILDTARNLDWNALADRILDGDEVTSDEALAVLHAPDSDVPALLARLGAGESIPGTGRALLRQLAQELE